MTITTPTNPGPFSRLGNPDTVTIQVIMRPFPKGLRQVWQAYDRMCCQVRQLAGFQSCHAMVV